MFFDDLSFLLLMFLGSLFAFRGARGSLSNSLISPSPLLLLPLLLAQIRTSNMSYEGLNTILLPADSSPLFTLLYYPFFAALFLVTLLTIFFILTYNVGELWYFSCFVTFIFSNAIFFFHVNSVLLFFLSYELFLLPSFFILYIFSKTRRAVEAAIYMFFWTQFGALFLFLSFLYLILVLQTPSFSTVTIGAISRIDYGILLTCWFVGFGVKIPIWPFYGWLPKAHVEASTNFSIFLSGVLVKFAFFGLLRCCSHVHLDMYHNWLLPPLLIGIIDGTWKLFSQIDLKKMVAYMTVIEMHWLCLATLGGYTPLIAAAICMLFNHAILSTQAFLLVDALARRYKTRLIFEIQGVMILTPLLGILILTNLLLFLGFPGTLSFVAEFLFFVFLFDVSPELWLGMLLFLYLLMPTFFFKNWFTVLFNAPHGQQNTPPLDVTRVEGVLFGSLSLISLWYGLNWQFFLL